MKHAPLARMPLEQLEVFFGRATPAEARIYARIPATGLPAGAKLTGSVRGPKCLFSQTLPATISLVDLGPGSSRVAEAVVPEPCYWKPGEPYLYDVRVSLEVGGQAWAQAEELLGVRPFGSNHRRLILEGKPWVLRAASPSDFVATTLPAWREAQQMLYLAQPSDSDCRAASEQGVGIVASVEGASDVAAELKRLSRWPAVMLAVAPASFEPGAVAPPANLMLGVRLTDGKPPAWAKAALVEPTETTSESWRGRVSSEVSLLAVCKLDGPRTLPALSERQKEFEASFPAGEWAGYVVVGE